MEDAGHPIGGVDCPRMFQATDDWFARDVRCRNYIRRLRWPKGFVCFDCGMIGEPWDEPWEMSQGRPRCRACGLATTLTAGTVFQATRKPLRVWFLAVWFVTRRKNGVGARH
jgi:hypothetical protein